MFAEWLEDAARHQGTANAVVQKDTYLSFRGLLHRASRRAEELRALGIEPGMGVGVLLGNASDVLVFAVALNQLGAAMIPLHPLTSARELTWIARGLPLRALVSRPGLRALAPESPWPEGTPPPLVPTKRTRLQGSLLSCALFRVQDLPALEPNTALVHVCPAPQGQYRLVLRSTLALAREAERLWKTLDTGDRPRLGVSLPLYQPFTLELVLTLLLGYGAEIHLDDDLAPRRIFGRLRETRPGLAPVTRALLRTLASLPATRDLDPALRLLCVDGPVERELDQAVRKAAGLRPLGLFHRPDTGLIAMDPSGRAPHTLGPPVSGVALRLVGARGLPVAEGRQGHLEVRLRAASDPGNLKAATTAPPVKGTSTRRAAPKNAARGTLKERDLAQAGSAETEGEWLSTGDIASLDSLGRLRLHGRRDDLVLVGGMPVSLDEVREVLTGHPAVVEAEISLPEADAPSSLDGAALLRARVVRRAAVSTETLLAHLGRHLAPFKVPGIIGFVSRLTQSGHR